MRMAAGRSDEAFSTPSILASRATLHFTWRLIYRLILMVGIGFPATAGAGIRHWLVIPFLGLDLATWMVLKRSDRPHVWWRIIVDGLDIAFWSLSPLPVNGFYDSSALLGIPLATEAGVRYGPGAVGVVGGVMGITLAIRAVAGRPLLPFTFLWLVLGASVGMALQVYCRRLYDEAERERARVRAADRRRAYVAGQNSVAMGASSVVDAIESVVPVLGRPAGGSALWQLAAGWKARLGEVTRAEAIYLGDALHEWERRHNQHPDLASRARIVLPEGDGTAMLTADQATWLRTALDEAGFRGEVPIALAEGEALARPPGAPLRLRVGGATITVPPDPKVSERPVDPGPVTFLFVAGQCLTLLPPTSAAPPVSAVGGLVALSVVLGWLSHRQLVRRGRAARSFILAAAVGLSFAITGVGAGLATNRFDTLGVTLYTGTGLILLAYLGGMYWYRLPRSLGWLLLAGVGGCCVLMLLLAKGPFEPRAYAVAVFSSLGPYTACRRISIALAEAADEHAARSLREDHALVIQSFLDGQDAVLELVRQARDDACQQLEELASSVEPRLLVAVSSRLEEVDRRLERMSDRSEWSSSMTTS